MIDTLCNITMKRIKAKMPDINEEREEVIRYGLELIYGEVPKNFVILLCAWFLGIFKYTIISFFLILPYRLASGGVHLKTHIGCIISTVAFYLGNVYLSKLINWGTLWNKLIFAVIVLVFSIIMITLYAPADTENTPILRKKDRAKRKFYSYAYIVAILVASFFIKDSVISNMCIFGVLFQTITISKFTYNIFKVKYGYLEYIKEENNA